MIVNIKENLILSTIDIGAKKGLECINIKGIAAKCGVSPAAMYYHFKNKYELLVEATFYVVEKLTEAINSTYDSSKSYEENYKNILQAIAHYDMAHREQSIYYNRMLVLPSMELKERDRKTIVDHCPLINFLKQGVARGDIMNFPDILSIAYFPLCTFLMNHFFRKITPDEAVLEAFIDSMWRAITVSGRERLIYIA